MQTLCSRVVIGMSGILALVGLVVMLNPHKAAADEERLVNGATYEMTLTDPSTGAFVARETLTLHADHSMAAHDSNENGPTEHFSGELGLWRFDDNGGVITKSINFDFPPNADIARLDRTIKFEQNRTKISGTFTVTVFPLQTGNPQGPGGTVIASLNFTGNLVTP